MSSSSNRKKKFIISNRQGMTLIELLVAFSIIAVGFIALMRSFPTALSINKSSETTTMAAFLAQQKIEEINSYGYDNIATGTIEEKHTLSTATSSYLFYFQRDASAVNIDGNLNATTSDSGMKRVTVNVYYFDPAINSNKIYSLYIISSKR